jgi:ABC-2 type transport system permease protein
MASQWKIGFFTEGSFHLFDKVIRFCLNTVFLGLYLSGANPLILLVLSVVMSFYLAYFHSLSKRKGFKWVDLIKSEENRMMQFYRIANLFTDVPQLKDTVKRRKWLDFLLRKITFNKEHALLYLISRTFLRTGDYFGLSARLSIIGFTAVYLVGNSAGGLLVSILFLYLTGFQLLPLWTHHDNKLWINLYPVPENTKKWAFKRLIMIVLSVQSMIFSISHAITEGQLRAFATLVASILFSYVFVTYYLVRKLK